MAHTDIGSVDEAEQVEESNGGHDVEIDLAAQFGFGLGVEVDQGMAISEFIQS